MSWLVRSIANTLTLDDEDDNPSSPNRNPMAATEKNDPRESDGEPLSPTSPSRGVKDDISELTKTLTRQFWGVASFLAPPPQAETYKPIQESDHNNSDEMAKFDSSSDPEGSDPKIAGIRSDFAEIGGRFRSGISKLSSNVNVSDFTKMASNFLLLGPDNEDSEELGEGNDSVMGAVGVTDEVIAFARDISMHPETWLDFPLPRNDDEDDFDLSDAQQEHALAVERLAPRLAALRIELCPGYMSEGCFWMIYFVLVHPRLSKKDAEVLSTPQIVKARAFLSQELKRRTNLQDLSGEVTADPKDSNIIEHEEILSVPSTSEFKNVPVTHIESASLEMEKYPVTSTDIPVVDKSVIEENAIGSAKEGNVHSDSSNLLVEKDEDDGDDWLKEESSEYGGTGGATINIENEEDVSFSDLEEEDDGDITATKKTSYSSDKDTQDWVQLSKSSADSSKKVIPNNPAMKETNDWLDVDDIDVA